MFNLKNVFIMTKEEMAQMIRYFANGVAQVIYPYNGESRITALEWAKWYTAADAVIEAGKISLESRYIVLECERSFLAPDAIVRYYNGKRLAFWYKF